MFLYVYNYVDISLCLVIFLRKCVCVSDLSVLDMHKTVFVSVHMYT